jgi:hypothetical protein
MFPFGNFITLSDYSFRRPFYERTGYSVVEKDGGLVVILNALGVTKDDIKVDVKPATGGDSIISITGKSHDEDFDCDFEIDTRYLVSRPLASLEWDTIDGFVKIWLKFEEPVSKVKIVRK